MWIGYIYICIYIYIHTYTYPLFFLLFSRIENITEYWVEFHVLYNRSLLAIYSITVKVKVSVSQPGRASDSFFFLVWYEILITWHKKVLWPDLGWFFFLMLYICTWFFYYNNLLKLHVLNLLITFRMYNKHTLNSCSVWFFNLAFFSIVHSVWFS